MKHGSGYWNTKLGGGASRSDDPLPHVCSYGTTCNLDYKASHYEDNCYIHICFTYTHTWVYIFIFHIVLGNNITMDTHIISGQQ